MSERFDVVIVGARCAGAPLATLLARAGMGVCLVDRARFPSDTPSTHIIQPRGVQILERLGVLDRLLAVAPAIDRGTVRFDDATVEVRGITEQVGAPVVNARRVTLDAFLVDAAAGAGVEVRTSTAVTGLVEEGGRVTGVTTSAGELRAPLVVGADGARSTVARMVGAPDYHRTPAGRAFLWGYFEGVPAEHDGLWLGAMGEDGFLASRTDEGLFMAAFAPSIGRWDDLRGDRAAAHATGLARWPELHAAMAGARRVGPVHAMARWHGFFRQSAGPGWVLVGDAGHFKDPTPGQGIADALRQSVELAGAIERSFGGAGDGALRDWWAWRDRDAWEMYWFAHDLGAPGAAPPLLQEIQRKIVGDPKLTEGLTRVLNHDVAPSKAFTPVLLLSALLGGLRRRRGERAALVREAGGIAGDQLTRRVKLARLNGRLRRHARAASSRAAA